MEHPYMKIAATDNVRVVPIHGQQSDQVDTK